MGICFYVMVVLYPWLSVLDVINTKKGREGGWWKSAIYSLPCTKQNFFSWLEGRSSGSAWETTPFQDLWRHKCVADLTGLGGLSYTACDICQCARHSGLAWISSIILVLRWLWNNFPKFWDIYTAFCRRPGFLINCDQSVARRVQLAHSATLPWTS